MNDKLSPIESMNPSASTRGELSPIDYHPRTRLVFGFDAIEKIGELSRQLGARKVLVISDRGIVRAGHVGRAVQALRKAGLKCFVFDGVSENPTETDVACCVAHAREKEIDLLVGLGGGSSMDTAKGCNLILTNGGRMRDYWGTGKAAKPLLPLIAVPTTAGTGSECQSFALISDPKTHQKMACGDPKAAARIALLDPTLTASQPRNVTACTGVDAIAHALETAVTTKRNAISSLFSREAFRLLAPNLPRVLADPEDLDARGRMLLGAAYAGTAIENSMLGIAHSTANPLTAHFNVIHGQAVGVMLPHTVAFNAKLLEIAAIYAELAGSVGLASRRDTVVLAVSKLIGWLERLLDQAGIPPRLADHKVKECHLPLLAREAADQWTAGFNPRRVTAAELEQVYRTGLAPLPRPMTV